MICWSVLVRSVVLTGSLCEFMDVCVFPRVSLNGLRYIREFSADDGGSSVLARWGFSQSFRAHPEYRLRQALLHLLFLFFLF